MATNYQEGYHIVVCSCGPAQHIGGRKSGTPDCCERCGFITQAQLDSLLAQFKDT